MRAIAHLIGRDPSVESAADDRWGDSSVGADSAATEHAVMEFFLADSGQQTPGHPGVFRGDLLRCGGCYAIGAQNHVGDSLDLVGNDRTGC